MSFDLDQIAQSNAATCRVIVAGNGDDAAGFVLVGPNSDQFRAAERAISIEGIMEAEKRRVALDLSRPEDAAKMYDNMESRRETLLQHCVVDWFGFKRNGDPVPFSREALVPVLRARPQWAKRLVAEIENTANFDGA